jgi:hypothetical protein
MSQSEPNITVIIIVSGQATSVTINVHQKVEHLAHEALKQTGNQGQQASAWELRTVDGRLVDQSLTVEAAGIVMGITLYLSPRAGAGGSLR